MKNQIIHIITAILLLLSPVMLAAQEQEISVPLSKSGERAKVVIDIKKGPITVQGTARQDVLVRYKSLESPEPKIEEASGGLKKISGGMGSLEIVEKNNEVYIESDSWNKGLEINAEVPRNVDLEVQTYHDGDIKISNVNGELVVESFHGPITAENISGSLVANTYHGPIKVTFNEITPDTPLAFSTYHGDVDVTFPPNYKASFKLKTEQGDIFTGFDMNLKAPEVKRQEDKEGGWRQTFVGGWITGTINGGGPEVLMKNYHGDIYIRKR
jgi:DUF4097 and DUF4098 domain-containing protein YvlB